MRKQKGRESAVRWRNSGTKPNFRRGHKEIVLLSAHVGAQLRSSGRLPQLPLHRKAIQAVCGTTARLRTLEVRS